MGVKEFQETLEIYNTAGLDTVCFIYHFEQKPGFGPLTKTLFSLIQEGKISAVSSVLVVGEVLTGAKRAGKPDLVLHYRHIFDTFPNLVVVNIDIELVEKMSDLRAKYNLKTPDAIHIAAALLGGAQAFITNDSQLKQVAEFEILVLKDYL